MQMMHGAFERTVEEPAYKAECKYISAFEYALVVETAIGKSGLCH